MRLSGRLGLRLGPRLTRGRLGWSASLVTAQAAAMPLLVRPGLSLLTKAIGLRLRVRDGASVARGAQLTYSGCCWSDGRCQPFRASRLLRWVLLDEWMQLPLCLIRPAFVLTWPRSPAATGAHGRVDGDLWPAHWHQGGGDQGLVGNRVWRLRDEPEGDRFSVSCEGSEQSSRCVLLGCSKIL